MKFRTEYNSERAGILLQPEKPVVCVGSCFAENVSQIMRGCLWDARNPLGTLFNPFSIAEVVKIVISNDLRDETIQKTLFERNGIWRSWLFDSKFSSVSRDSVQENVLKALKSFRTCLEKSQAVIITFGTARYYSLENGMIVANCHKMPQDLFAVRRATVCEIAEVWKKLVEELKGQYPSLEFIFTVSPVRHIKDGFEENMRSKATLILSVEEICREFNFCHYFPAFEILNDDLRDYRFYAGDLVHPSSEAIEYIWELFQKKYLSSQSITLLKEGRSLYQRAQHRFIVEDSPESDAFRLETSLKKEEFARKHPLMLKI